MSHETTDPKLARQADLALLLAVIVWGSSFVMVKELLTVITPAGLVGLRFAMACPLLFAVVVVRGRVGSIAACVKPGLALGAMLAVVFVTQTIGLQFTRASNSAFITGMFVVFTPLMAWVVVGLKPKALDSALAGMALVGMALLSLQFSGPDAFSPNPGDLITLITAAAQALHIVYTHRHARRGLDPFALLLVQFMVVSAASFATAPLYAGGVGALGSLSTMHWVTLVYLAAFPACLTYLVQTVVQRFTEPMHISLMFSLEPVFASLFAFFFLLEGFGPQQLAGAGLVLGACVISELSHVKPRRKTAPLAAEGMGEAEPVVK